MTKIEHKAIELANLIDLNNDMPLQARMTDTTTAVVDGENFIMLNGSAHEIKNLWWKLFEQRPEMRQVVMEVLKNKYKEY